jgi:hypothetical protein
MPEFKGGTMAGTEVRMSKKELKKHHLINNILERKITQIEVAEILGISDRQVRAIVKRVRIEGEKGVIHRLRGRASNRAYSEGFKTNVLELYEEKYGDFGPTLASEKLLELDHIKISDETLRLWLIKENKWEGRRKGRKHRRWRERKHWFGAMVQMDGSHHDWLEGRGPWLVLMGYIDDATGEVHARFYLYEGTIPALDSFKRYVQKYGIPQSVYFDKHTTYKSPKKPSIEDELLNREALTQFGRALQELGVDFIHAHSPQAKGRIERLFRTFQDRLIKEMRLQNIKTMEEANVFLENYLPRFNQRFRVQAIEKGNLHRPIPKGLDLDSILCKKTEHPLRNDFTVMHDKKVYQVLITTKALRVMVEERVNGKLYITYKGKRLSYKEIPRTLYSAPRQFKQKMIRQDEKPQKLIKPPKNHPWRHFVINPYKRADVHANTVMAGYKLP